MYVSLPPPRRFCTPSSILHISPSSAKPQRSPRGPPEPSRKTARAGEYAFPRPRAAAVVGCVDCGPSVPTETRRTSEPTPSPAGPYPSRTRTRTRQRRTRSRQEEPNGPPPLPPLAECDARTQLGRMRTARQEPAVEADPQTGNASLLSCTLASPRQPRPWCGGGGGDTSGCPAGLRSALPIPTVTEGAREPRASNRRQEEILPPPSLLEPPPSLPDGA